MVRGPAHELLKTNPLTSGSLTKVYHVDLRESVRLSTAPYSSSVDMSDSTGAILANVLQSNNTLRAFTLCCFCTKMSDIAGTAMAQSLQNNSSLRSFTLKWSGTRMTDITGAALAAALQNNEILEAFALDFSCHFLPTRCRGI